MSTLVRCAAGASSANAMALAKSSAPTFEGADLLLMRRSRRILLIAMSPFLAALVSALARGAEAAPYFVLIGLFSTIVAYLRNPRPSFVSVFVRAGAEGVTIGKSWLPRSRIRAGLAFPGAAPRVVLRRRFLPSVELQTRDPAQAQALLRALGLDCTHMVVSFRALSRGFEHPDLAPGSALAIALVAFAGTWLGEPARAISACLWIPALVVFMLPARLHVGANSVERRWLWTSRIVPLEQIEDVALYEDGWARVVGLRFVLTSGTMYVPMGIRFRGSTEIWGETELTLAWQRIRESMEEMVPAKLSVVTPNGSEPAVTRELP